jgi:hypothetical protein
LEGIAEDGNDRGAGAAQGAMGDAMRQMRANQETLKRVDDKAAAVASSAAEFKSLTSQLKDQAKAKANKSSIW